MAHESWHLSLKHYVATRRDLLTAWAGHRDELAVRMVEVCREVCHTHQAAAVARTQRNQWRQRCDKLYNKVPYYFRIVRECFEDYNFRVFSPSMKSLICKVVKLIMEGVLYIKTPSTHESKIVRYY